MARPSVYIPDQLLDAARAVLERQTDSGEGVVSTSFVVQCGLRRLVEEAGRPKVSERGRLETLAALRTVRLALVALEETLVQDRPVRRRVRRVR